MRRNTTPAAKPDGDEDGLLVQRKQCTTCIYRPKSPLDVDALEAQIRDPRMLGFFEGFRICHHSTRAICAGFWARHKSSFTLGQLAIRLGLVRLVDEDRFKRKEER